MRLLLNFSPTRPGSSDSFVRKARMSAFEISPTGLAPKCFSRWPSRVERSTLMCERRHSTLCSVNHCSANTVNDGVAEIDTAAACGVASVPATGDDDPADCARGFAFGK
jgi:hypothetical protein